MTSLQNLFLDTQVSLAPTLVSPSSVHKGFGFPFCQCLWDLTKRRDDIAVADMVADMAADMKVHMVADMEVDKVADDAKKKKKKGYPI